MEQAESPAKRKILVAPLDWGLGHATRCVPIIRELLQQGAGVVLAGEGATKKLLQAEFPQLPFAELKGYGVRYSSERWSLPFVLASQIPKILSAIQYENERVAAIVKEHGIQGIISDNRYGLYHEGLPTVFITHQLLIKTGWGTRIDQWLQSLHYHHLQKFTECWVPDAPGTPNLGGELSHPEKKPALPLHYLGQLSRMKAGNSHEQHLLVLLSGPEPQRTIFEKLLWEQLESYKGSVIWVRGLPEEEGLSLQRESVQVFNHLPAEALNKFLNEASFVISRCGYSTLMDLAAVQKKSILIPTPGQTEQEYLATHLMQQQLALCLTQEKFRLQQALDLARDFYYRPFPATESNLKQVVATFLNTNYTN